MDGKEIIVKALMIGDPKVGKTALIHKFKGDGFSRKYDRTLGFGYHTFQQGRIRWLIWDLGGQSTFRALQSPLYDGAEISLLVFDLTRWKTLKHTPLWIKDFWNSVGKQKPFILIGNKRDLASRRTVSTDIVRKFQKKFSELHSFNVPYLETSAKTGQGVEKMFKMLPKVLKRYLLRKKQSMP